MIRATNEAEARTTELTALRNRLGRISAIPVCPFEGEDGRIDMEGYRRQVGFLARSGADVVVPCGNTTEFFSMTLDEAKSLVTATVDAIQGQVAVVAGVGYDVDTACALARHAEESGADGIMIHQPIQPFVTNDGLVAYLRTIARSVSIGVVLYVRQDILSPADYHALFSEPNVIAVKHATNDLQCFATLVRETAFHEIAWICGSAERWAPFYHVAGARGFTSGLINLAPHISLAMRDALEAGDIPAAMEIWEKICAFEELRSIGSSRYNVTVVKEAMNLVGLPGGVVRPPAASLPAEHRASLVEILRKWDLSPTVA